MIIYILKRTVTGLLLIIGITILTFLFIRLAPGNPLNRFYDPTKPNPEMQTLAKQWALERPLGEQLRTWIRNTLRGDLGKSFVSNRPVTEVLMQTLPNTLILTVAALVLKILFGSILGIIQVAHINRRTDRWINTSALIIYGMPTFLVALFFVMVFSHILKWLPSSQMISFNYESFSWLGKIMDRITHIILPVLSLSLLSIAATSRYVRNCLADVLSQEYILAARARGIPTAVIFKRHAFKNVLVPTVTWVGQHLPFLVGGSVVIETIFSWPGMGRLIVISTFARDYPVIVACTAIIAIFVVFGNILADVICAYIDPRIRLES